MKMLIKINNFIESDFVEEIFGLFINLLVGMIALFFLAAPFVILSK